MKNKFNDFRSLGKEVCTSTLQRCCRGVAAPSPKQATCGHLLWDAEQVLWPLLPCKLDEAPLRSLVPRFPWHTETEIMVPGRMGCRRQQQDHLKNKRSFFLARFRHSCVQQAACPRVPEGSPRAKMLEMTYLAVVVTKGQAFLGPIQGHSLHPGWTPPATWLSSMAFVPEKHLEVTVAQEELHHPCWSMFVYSS